MPCMAERLTVTILEHLFWANRRAAWVLGDPNLCENLSLGHLDFARQRHVHMSENYRRLMHHRAYRRDHGRFRQVTWE